MPCVFIPIFAVIGFENEEAIQKSEEGKQTLGKGTPKIFCQDTRGGLEFDTTSTY